MAKPILIVRVDGLKSTVERREEIRQSYLEVTGGEYHVVVLPAPFSEKLPIIEVHGISEISISGEDLKVTFDRVNNRLGRV